MGLLRQRDHPNTSSCGIRIQEIVPENACDPLRTHPFCDNDSMIALNFSRSTLTGVSLGECRSSIAGFSL
jgi:hypothetical protein